MQYLLYGSAMTNKTWRAFIDTHSRNETNAAIAKRLGIAASNITRWRAGTSTPDPQKAVDFANAYKVSPLSALVAAGYLEESTLDHALVAPADLSEIDTAQLLDELQRRLGELRDTFDTLERTSDRDALETVVDALTHRHLPPKVRGAQQTEEHIERLTREEVEKLQSGYTLAALDGQDPQAEQEAPDIP